MDSTSAKVPPRRCCCCETRYPLDGSADGWRQRTAALAGSKEQVLVHLCATCIGWFPGEPAIERFLAAALEQALARRNLRSAG